MLLPLYASFTVSQPCMFAKRVTVGCCTGTVSDRSLLGKQVMMLAIAGGLYTRFSVLGPSPWGIKFSLMY